MARCRESFSSLVFSQTLLSQTQPWGNATDTQFYKVSHYYSFLFQNPSFNNYNIKQLQSGLRWSEKSQLWPKSQKDCLIRWHRETKLITFFYLETFRSDQQQKISSKYVSSKVVHHPGLRTLSVGHVDLAGCMKYIQEFYLSIQILSKLKRFEFWKNNVFDRAEYRMGRFWTWGNQRFKWHNLEREGVNK